MMTPGATTVEAMTWSRMVEIEPSLARLRQRAVQLPYSWPNYERLKTALKSLVGWDARNPRLRTCEAWNCAHPVILAALEQRSPPKRRP
jgi:hypothetical protein